MPLKASGKGTAQWLVFFLSFLLNPVGDFSLTPTPHVALGKKNYDCYLRCKTEKLGLLSWTAFSPSRILLSDASKVYLTVKWRFGEGLMKQSM